MSAAPGLVALAVRSGAGNRQLARFIAASNAAASGDAAPPTRRVARFVGHEHETIGNVTGADVDLGNGVVLTWGQVVAIAGDEFESLDELREAATTDAGRRRIRAALEHDGVKGPIPASLPPATDDDRKQQTLRFIELAMKNVTHFAAGGSARETWRSHHATALRKAMEAGLSGDAALFAEAEATEAFGQHFLTDMFSGGHVRTPRQEIMTFYQAQAATMATAFIANVRARVEPALVSQVLLQIDPHFRGAAQNKVRNKIHAAVDQQIAEGLAKIGGQAKLNEYFGLALAGAVSGAIHDREGRKGVVVKSEAHPQPWLAKGDAMLDQSPESRNQAELAVLGGREQLFQARAIGEKEKKVESVVPTTPPEKIFFAFDSSDLDGSRPAAEAAGAYLHVHPGMAVELVGNTDPLGGAAYNQQLGLRRAAAVKSALIAAGARPDQVAVTSVGKSNPVTNDPRRYSENRRVEFHWQPDSALPPNQTRTDPARDRAEEAVAALGPPYRAVEQYVPEAVENQNDPLPEWRWGSMDKSLVSDVDKWVRDMVGPHVKTLSAAVPQTIVAEGYTVAPRQIVEPIIDELIANPTATLGRLVGPATK